MGRPKLPPRPCRHCGLTDPRRDRPSVCRPCGNAFMRKWFAAHPERAHQATDNWKARQDPEAMRIARNARMATFNAIRKGTLTRPSACEQCGKGGRIEAAHHDYTRPLDVRWLCQSCHRSWDIAEPKTRQAA